MHAFVPVRGGFAARLEQAERTVLSRLVADTAELLGTRLTDAGSGAGAAEGGPDLPEVPGPADGPQNGDDAVLAALDFEPAADAVPDAPADPALARLLPPMSHDDPKLSAELRALTESSLRAGKVSRLETVWRELRVPAGAQGAVVVRAGQEGAWLAALTDVRLVLAARLGIEDEADAEEVYARSRPGRDRDADEDRDEVDDALATMYAALTWWQESLLEAMLRKRRGR
ncbi:DUF2017 family protein [Georgenia subflava]|uniref:DUF2017 family protein n=1 Tax=Georgenia subflava TaxID=1622177 RepID=A0A6N7EMX5_9MICO|nr:DUF2017 family protein [Georgenia subflava]MPV37496.1 DUF2017 family protein [Georgenia subflava]